MAPRFVEVRRIPLKNETVTETVETVMESISEFVTDLVYNHTTIIFNRVSYHVDDWSTSDMGAWVIEMCNAVPRSSVFCFVLAVLCLCMYATLSMILARSEWKRLRRAYEN